MIKNISKLYTWKKIKMQYLHKDVFTGSERSPLFGTVDINAFIFVSKHEQDAER